MYVYIQYIWFNVRLSNQTVHSVMHTLHMEDQLVGSIVERLETLEVMQIF